MLGEINRIISVLGTPTFQKFVFFTLVFRPFPNLLFLHVFSLAFVPPPSFWQYCWSLTEAGSTLFWFWSYLLFKLNLCPWVSEDIHPHNSNWSLTAILCSLHLQKTDIKATECTYKNTVEELHEDRVSGLPLVWKAGGSAVPANRFDSGQSLWEVDKEANSTCQAVVWWHTPWLEGTCGHCSDAHKARQSLHNKTLFHMVFPSCITLLPPTLPPSFGHASDDFLVLFLDFPLAAPNTLSFSLPPLAPRHVIHPSLPDQEALMSSHPHCYLLLASQAAALPNARPHIPTQLLTPLFFFSPTAHLSCICPMNLPFSSLSCETRHN